MTLPRERIGRGIAFMVAAVALFNVMGALVKWLGPHYPIGQLMFFRNAFAIPAGLAIVPGQGGLSQLRTERPFEARIRIRHSRDDVEQRNVVIARNCDQGWRSEARYELTRRLELRSPRPLCDIA